PTATSASASSPSRVISWPRPSSSAAFCRNTRGAGATPTPRGQGLTMRVLPSFRTFLVLATLLATGATPLRAQDSFADVAEQVNRKVVKLFGSGGYQNLAAYGTGFLVSPDGYVLTASSPLLQTPDLRVHLYDGRRFS